MTFQPIEHLTYFLKTDEIRAFVNNLKDVVNTKYGILVGDLCPVCFETWDMCDCEPGQYEDFQHRESEKNRLLGDKKNG